MLRHKVLLSLPLLSRSQKVSEKPDRFKKVTYHWYNCKTCQVYFLLLTLTLVTACAAPSTADDHNPGEANQAPGEEEHEDSPEHSEEHRRIPNNGAVIRIASPADGATFKAGDDIIVEVETENFPLSEEGLHWHVFVDGASWGMVEGGSTDQVLRGVESGQHNIAVYLSNSVHEELEEGDMITVMVGEVEE